MEEVLHRCAVVAAGAALLGWASASSAQVFAPPITKNGWYVGGEAGWTRLADEPARAVIPVFGPRSDNERWDAGFNFGARAGYAWNGWRLEEELRIQRNEPATFSGASASGQAVAYAAMTNLIYDFIAFDLAGVGPITVHAGAGLGAVTVHDEIKTPGFSNGVVTGTDTEFGYQAIGGLTYRLTPEIALDFDYRYLATVQPRLRTPPAFVDGGQPAGNLPVGTGYHTHSLVASLIYKFDGF